MRILLILFLFVSCGSDGLETPKQQFEREKREFNSIKGLYSDTFYVITVDGCDYVVYQGSRMGGIVHKANCKNH